MDPIKRFETIHEYNVFNNNETLHPLVSIVDLSKAAPRGGSKMYFGFYTIFVKEVKCGDIVYGRQTYDYQEGTLVFLAPGQTAGVNSKGEIYQPKGYALVFHPDLIIGTSVGKRIKEYAYFSYQSNESLHLSKKEKEIILDCFSKIKYELEQTIDKHSKKLIAANIELLLDYCLRFYDRQFLTREYVHKGVMSKLDVVIANYLNSEKISSIGLPTVSYCAQELHLSAGYFGDLVKKKPENQRKNTYNTPLFNWLKKRWLTMTKASAKLHTSWVSNTHSILADTLKILLERPHKSTDNNRTELLKLIYPLYSSNPP